MQIKDRSQMQGKERAAEAWVILREGASVPTVMDGTEKAAPFSSRAGSSFGVHGYLKVLAISSCQMGGLVAGPQWWESMIRDQFGSPLATKAEGDKELEQKESKSNLFPAEQAIYDLGASP
ncbi:hypothetical protein BDW68DRAFT_30636 [Aspergillus falconensis]